MKTPKNLLRMDVDSYFRMSLLHIAFVVMLRGPTVANQPVHKPVSSGLTSPRNPFLLILGNYDSEAV